MIHNRPNHPRMTLPVVVCLAAWMCAAAALGNGSPLVFDFEHGAFDGWRVVEGQLVQFVSDRAVEHHTGKPFNKHGTHYLTTLDDLTPDGHQVGVAESPVFRLDAPDISFLIAGGRHTNTYVALCDASGREVRKAHGVNAQPLRTVSWSVPHLVGQNVFLRMTDGHPGHWGYIAMDHLRARGRIDPVVTEKQFGERRPVLKDAGGGLLEDLLLKAHSILFVTRHQYRNEHGTEATMYQTGEINTHCFQGGGALKLFDVAGGQVTAILNSPAGVIRDPDVHFDGRKILFSMRRDIGDDYHLYEINIDGGGLKQLTFSPCVSDIQAIYLPDGTIVFSSTRDPKYIPCQRHLMANLFRMNGDGSNIHQIGYNTQFEGRASLMPDGRILYTRWEYVDKHFSSAYGLWTVNPDGTGHALYYGGYAWQPGSIVDARTIPDTSRFVAVFTGVHLLGWGAMVVADRSRGLDGMVPILRSWPPDIGPFMSVWDKEERVGSACDSFRSLQIKYEDPYPLSKDIFLCSRQVAPGKHMGIYAVDTSGREVRLHTELPGCFDPMPVVSRKRPPAIESKTNLSKSSGTFYVQDVYIGEFMERVPRGTVKYLRVVEAPPKRTFPKHGIGDWTPFGNADAHHPVAVNWNHYNSKRILGTVPVEEDGSAYFEAPAGCFVYFQLLDEDGMMIHSMRSGTMLQPGESKGCVGCHEDRLRSPQVRTRTSMAFKRKPDTLTGWYGAPRRFGYAVEVQPVLDKHCVACHDHGKTAGKINLSGDKGIVFNQSYTTLMRRSPAYWVKAKPGAERALIRSVGAGPVKVIPPYSWGSSQSRLIDMLKAGHPAGDGTPRVSLDTESLDRLVTWIDLNCPYYPSHVTYYGGNTAGRSPLDHRDLAELGTLILRSPKGKPYGWDVVNAYAPAMLTRVIATHGSPVSFTRPELSLCLTGFVSNEDPDYMKALALIRKGADNLIAHPRLDMPGFQPCEADQARLDFLAQRQAVEQLNREALLRGERRWDRKPGEQD